MLTLLATFCRNYPSATGLGLGAVMAASGLLAPPAEARHWRSHHGHLSPHAHFAARHHERSIRYHRAGTSARASHIAAIVVDGNSGQTLYAKNENELRFPASVTKVMTLYLLFEQLEQGRLRLDSDIRVSAYAAAQKPTKLGLRPGQTISADDAIKAVVTRSANDIAVAIAETIGGDEERFARLMTSKAHALGMSSTHFANASGLPNAQQVTTAHDLAILGRAVQERFPRYYRYFATRTFYYHGATIANHNHLLDRVEGMDGIKTGYTNASGFNLLTSVKRNGRYIVAVVLGGSSARARDLIMADLVEEQIGNGAAIRTASSIIDTSTNTEIAEPVQEREQSPPPRPQLNREPGLSVAHDPVRVASLNAEVPSERPRPAFVPGAQKFALRVDQGGPKGQQALLDGPSARGRTGRDLEALASATMPVPLPTATGRLHSRPDTIAAVIQEKPQNGAARTADDQRPSAARGGWMIQIGATNDAGKAAELLARARSEGPKTLANAQAFTEKIKKGQETLYRARFAGLEENSAELTCKALKRSGFSCFATRD